MSLPRTYILFFLLIPGSAFAADSKKVAIPFDFVSKFDNGRYGRIVGELIWKKLEREGGFIIPESMDDVRNYCESHRLQPSPETSLEEMRKIVVDGFDAQIGIWGGVERAGGEESNVYDLTIKCVDFSVATKPKIVYDATVRTKSVSEIPHVYVKQLLDAIYERKPGEAAAPNATAELNWKKNRNLLSGDFERGDGGVPGGWQKVCGQQREPLGRLVQWTAEHGKPENKVVRFTLDRTVAENEGVMYYSDIFPVEEGATYRFQCRWRSKGPAVKVFIKCYDDESSEYRAESRDEAVKTNDKEKNRREVYRSQQNLSDGPVNTWTWATHTEDFTPRHVKYSPRWGSVMLYAYLLPGEVEFDDVAVKQIVPPSPGERQKVRRHSRETKVTIEEMERNERRSETLKQRPAP